MIMSDLPLELLEEILSRVPATSLKQIQSTCKRWYALFKDQSFTEKHFRKAPKQSLVLLLKYCMVCSMSVKLNVAPPSIDFKGTHQEVDILEVSHCDGLLLCVTKENNLVVWNPCLGKTWWIQHKSSGHMKDCKLALGYVNNKSYRSYKILKCSSAFLLGTKSVWFEIYEFSSGSWRLLDQVANIDCIIVANSVSLKGNTYWRALDEKDNSKWLLSFDFTTERFKRMCPLTFLSEGFMALSVVGEEKLSVLHTSYSKIDIWVTNKFDTEVALQWTKSFTMDIPIHGKFPPGFVSFVMDEEKKVALCCTRSREDMVYIIGDDHGPITFPCPEYPNEPDVGSFNKPFVFNYVPSLVQVQQGRGKRKV
ncbi:putative F-box/kelch-repeat protein [Cardamine amara subsp. amara]|uniref:F-box/kelch-repeat protein n=1 Tax=Cardamine amara subsp. amara TaxID=228776 RepID=A0ABD1A0F6_CARAN